MNLRHLLILVGLHFIVGLSVHALDNDNDGIEDAVDNCLLVTNADQRDTDGDNIGNACDADINNDCTVNFLDIVRYANNFSMLGDLDTDNNGDGITNFIDFAVFRAQSFGSPGPSALYTLCNTASQLTASASSSSELQPASLAVDDSLVTRWESVHGIDPGVLDLDLNQSFPLSRVEIHWEAANAAQYTIEGSNDNFSWEVLASFSGGQFGDRTDVLNISGTYRYVRMNGQLRSTT